MREKKCPLLAPLLAYRGWQSTLPLTSPVLRGVSKPPKKPAPPTRVTVAAVNKAAQAASDNPAAATMMVNTAAWLHKTIPVASAALRAADPASLAPRSKSAFQVLIGEVMAAPLAAYSGCLASVQPAEESALVQHAAP